MGSIGLSRRERQPRVPDAEAGETEDRFSPCNLLYYGPDETRASKAVVGIVPTEGAEETSTLRRWFSEDTDVRTDPTIVEEIVDMLDEHEVHRVATVEGIVGCPHEEGVDYPEGEWCPECPYWRNRDRWTGEII